MMRVAANCQPLVSGCRHRGRSAGPAWPAATRAVRSRARGLSLLTACTSENGDRAAVHEDRFTVTTPLYYVNAAPHMGSAYPTIAADTLARYHRLRGRKVAFVTGTDEHGEKIALAAEKRGLAAKEHCDGVVQDYKGLWKMLDIQYDSFIRTTDAKHEALVLEILERVWAAGDIYKAQYEGWYCVGCEAYLDDTELDEQHICRTHRTPCQHRREENYFFRLSRYQEALGRLVLESDGGFIEPVFRGNEVAGWVKSGLRDFSISRAAVEWGIRIPRDPAQTVYVWFDALIGYLSGLLPPGVEPSMAALQQHGWPANVHIIGKDILRFHAVYWPAMLMSAGLPLPAKVYGHGFLTKDGLKMGKSLGNVLDPVALVQAYGPDAVRFYLMNEITFGADGDFSEERFRSLVNSSLANGIGNLLNRTLTLLKKNCSSTLPHGAGSIPSDNPLRQVAERAPAAAASALESMKFREAAEAALEIAGRGNQYLEETAPWTALKKGTDEEKAAAALVLVAVLEALRIISVLLFPFTPSLSRRIHLQLGLEEAALDGICWDDAQWGQLQAGHTFPKPTPVFVRLEGDLVFTPANAATNAAEAAGAVPQAS